MLRNVGLCACVLLAALAAGAIGAEQAVEVRDDASLRAAVRQAKPGTRIQIAPGRYQPGVYVSNLRGTADAPIVIEGADPANPPMFEGGGEAWHLSNCQYVTLRNLAARKQSSNGFNVDDGGNFDTPARQIVLENLRVSETGPTGNHDPIKLSGLDDFVVRGCTIEGWGGQAIDMVGCHRGRIEDCTFRGRPGFSQNAGPQTKGGSSEIAIRNCRFFGPIDRGVQVGGSTSLSVFRPQGAKYEAKDITVEGCRFVGGTAAATFVGVDGATFRYNTILRPERWTMRILQETTLAGFAPCRNVRVERNLFVFRRAGLQAYVNIGPNTRPETFIFADNWWHAEDRPAASKPDLPARETGGVYGQDPKLAEDSLKPQNPKAAAFGAFALPSKE